MDKEVRDHLALWIIIKVEFASFQLRCNSSCVVFKVVKGNLEKIVFGLKIVNHIRQALNLWVASWSFETILQQAG